MYTRCSYFVQEFLQVTKEQHSRWCGKTSTAEMAPKAHLLLRTRGLLRDAGIGVGIYAHPGSLVGP